MNVGSAKHSYRSSLNGRAPATSGMPQGGFTNMIAKTGSGSKTGFEFTQKFEKNELAALL